jgi:glucose-6-phosphate 1-dehydrogenase
MHLVVLGGSGDLVSRYLGPALLELERAGALPEDLSITGAARKDWSDDDMRRHLGRNFSEDASLRRAADRLLERARFRKADASRGDDLRRLLEGTREALVYLALPPQVAGEALEGLARAGLPQSTRVAVEKPFGVDLASARELNARIRRCFDDAAVFRIDHFLGLPAVRDLLPLRFANPLLGDAFDAKRVERVEIVWDEVNTLEGRAGYYDHTGALKDMIQNHLLVVLASLALEPPRSLDPCDVRAARAGVLRAIPSLSIRDAARCSTRARYAAGQRGPERIGAYLDEHGVERSRETETFAEVTLRVDNERWAGVPFRIRTGKGLARDRHHVDVHFRGPAAGLYPGAKNRLRIQLEPEGLALELRVAGKTAQGEAVSLSGEPRRPEKLGAYARVLQGLLDGDAAVSVGGEEAEEAWRIVEPFLEAWRQGLVPLETYPAGSDGPERDAAGGAPTPGKRRAPEAPHDAR